MSALEKLVLGSLDALYNSGQFKRAATICSDFELEEMRNIPQYNPQLVNSFYCYYLASLIASENVDGASCVRARIPEKCMSTDIAFLRSVEDLISNSNFNYQSMTGREPPAFIRDNIYNQILSSWRIKQRFEISKVYECISLPEFQNKMFYTEEQALEDCAHFGWAITPGTPSFIATRPVSSGSKERTFPGSDGLKVMVDLVKEFDRPSLMFDHTPIFEQSIPSERDKKSAKMDAVEGI